MRLNAKQLRRGYRLQVTGDSMKKNEIYIILDNVLDTYNIGSIFRLADAVAAQKVYLCGQTETPPNSRIKKASINTTEWVEWEYCESTVKAIAHLRGEAKESTGSHFGGVQPVKIVAVEQSIKSVQYDKFEYSLPICLIVGNETEGVSKEVLDVCDAIVEIPMFGVNKSLNVMVSLGIVLYRIVSNKYSKGIGNKLSNI